MLEELLAIETPIKPIALIMMVRMNCYFDLTIDFLNGDIVVL
jgi:hypothetical protein